MIKIQYLQNKKRPPHAGEGRSRNRKYVLSSPACVSKAQPCFGLAFEIGGKYALAHASSVNGERSSDSYLTRPNCEDLPGIFTCSPWGPRAHQICLDLPVSPVTGASAERWCTSWTWQVKRGESMRIGVLSAYGKYRARRKSFLHPPKSGSPKAYISTRQAPSSHEMKRGRKLLAPFFPRS